MKAIVIRRFGPPDVLGYEDVPEPAPRAGEIRIRVHATTVNRVLDVGLRAGKPVQPGIVLPLIPGVDCAGVVDGVGTGVTHWRIGDRVAAAGVMPLEVCAPDGAGYEGPSGMMGVRRPGRLRRAGRAAGLRRRRGAGGARFPPRGRDHAARADRVESLVQCGVPEGGRERARDGGGRQSRHRRHPDRQVGHRRDRHRGGRFGRPRPDGLDLGADHGVNYNARDIRDAVMEITGGRGVDVLYDNIANPKMLPRAFKTLGRDGRLVTAGAHGGPDVSIDFRHLYHNRITIIGMPGHRPADRATCFAAAAEGKIKAQIERVMPLSQAVAAHRLVESGEAQGKIVLDPTLG